MTTSDFFLQTIDRRERLDFSLRKLNNDWQRLAVILYLMGFHQGEIAGVYGCTRQRVQQVIAEYKRRNGITRL